MVESSIGRTRQVVDRLRQIKKQEPISVASYEDFLMEHKSRGRRRRKIGVEIESLVTEAGIELSATYTSRPNSRRQTRSADVVLKETQMVGFGARIMDLEMIANRVVVSAVNRRNIMTQNTHIPFEILINGERLLMQTELRARSAEGVKPYKLKEKVDNIRPKII